MESSEIKIAFLGTSAFADIIRDKLLESDFEIAEEVDASCDLLVVASYGQIVSKDVLEDSIKFLQDNLQYHQRLLRERLYQHLA